LVIAPSSFAIEEGAWIGVIGPNGGGKSTLLRLLMGFLEPNSGTLRIFGKTPIEARQWIGYVPQSMRSDRLFPITLEEVVSLGGSHGVNEWIDRLGLSPHRKKRFGTLSGGLAQRTLVARALVSNPKLLLLDESISNIDPASAKTILDILAELKGSTTILFVTHDLNAIVERVKTILCVHRTIECHSPTEICEHFAMGLYHTPLLSLPKNHWGP
jgi:zinc transport system ATP-binding protein